MGQDTDMDYTATEKYGVTSSDQNAKKCLKIPQEFAEVLENIVIRCPKCEHLFYTRVSGIQFAETFEGHCQNENCANHQLPMSYKISKHWPINLTSTYMTLTDDTGFRGIQGAAWANQCNPPLKDLISVNVSLFSR